jgi:hypothetical protein
VAGVTFGNFNGKMGVFEVFLMGKWGFLMVFDGKFGVF